MKFSVFIKRLKNPRVRKRLKIALSVYAVAIILGISFKTVYNIGYFNAKALDDEKRAKRNPTPFIQRVMTKQYAQRIVSSVLKEDPANPKTIVERISSNSRKLSSIVIKNNGVKKVAWIIDMRLFFVGDLLDEGGYSLTKAGERKHNITNSY
jgi:hypothetical protein